MRALAILATVLIPLWALAQSPCDSLSEAQRAIVEEIFKTEHPYDACDKTFEECLKERPVAPLVRRLADWICRKAKGGADAKAVMRSLERRGLSMMRPGKTFEIDLSKAPVAGCPKAKVTVVAYVCARCPYCAKLIPALYNEVTSGRLAGKVALYFRLFPIKSHEHSTEANLGVAAAMALGKGWEYLLRAYRGFDSFSVEALPSWAEDVGLDREAFEGAMKDQKTRDLVVESKKEGLRNGVEATPTIFISGRHFKGDLDLDTVVDAIQEEIEATD